MFKLLKRPKKVNHICKYNTIYTYISIFTFEFEPEIKYNFIIKQEVKCKNLYYFGFFVSIQIIIVRLQENIIIDIHISQLDSPFPPSSTQLAISYIFIQYTCNITHIN